MLHGLLMASAAVTLPSFLQRSAWAIQDQRAGVSAAPGEPDERVLVVVQFSGGNDGLNTLVPFGFGEYYKARPGIAVPEKTLLRLDGADGVGLHPALRGVADLYAEGNAAIVQGVGYPNPNRSHFKSMDIWHTADLSATGDGWLGKYFDSECCGFGKGESGAAPKPERHASPPMISIGRSAPLATVGRGSQAVSFEQAELFRWSAAQQDAALGKHYDKLNRGQPPAAGGETQGGNADFLVRTATDAQLASDTIRKAVAKKPQTQFPRHELGRRMQMIASMIGAGMKTRVYYVSHGSFDTHAQQGGEQGRHAQLLSQFAEAMKAFQAELAAQGNAQRVLTMVFSEFGRRVAQNQSNGTDHGTAAPMMFFGPMVRSGLIGDHPSMSDLDEGDLKFGLDFRGVYAGVLDGWMKADSAKVLGATFEPVRLLRA
jgi:uncharacterized protein (DUF1501 family)